MIVGLKQKQTNAEKFSTRRYMETPQATGMIMHGKAAHRRSTSLIKSLIFADILITFLLYAAFACASNNLVSFRGFNLYVALMMSAVIVACTFTVGAYNENVRMRTLRYFCEHMVGSLLAFFIVIALSFLFMPMWMGVRRSTIILTMLVTPCVTVMLRRSYGLTKSKKTEGKSLIAIGDGNGKAELSTWMKMTRNDNSVYVVGSQTGIVNSSPDSPGDKNLMMQTLEQAIQSLDKKLDAIVITCRPDELDASLLNYLVVIDFNVVPVYTIESFSAKIWQIVPLSTLSAQWALDDGFVLNRSDTYERIKRSYDIVLSGAAILVLSPILLLVACLIKLDSKGPVIFRQERIGLREKTFTLFKFRSMKVGSERGAAYTCEKDSRITRIGCLLRHTRLDELPQLFNVLRGDMSLIGPRAEWDKLVKDYERIIPFYHFRHLVKPGITGWAQVNYPYGANLEDTRNKLRYDLYYVRYFSLLLDFSIMVKTVFVMLFGKGR